MKTTLLSIFCLFALGWGNIQTVLAQDLQEMEQKLATVSDELNLKTKEYSWQLAEAYADYCEANNKYITWNDIPSLRKIIEFERPASLETYRLEFEARKAELQKFLNTNKEYRELKKKQSEAVSKEAKDAISATFTAFYKKLREEENPYRTLYYAELSANCKYRVEALRYIIAQCKSENQVVPTSFIKYSDSSYLLQKGSKLELLRKELDILEELQKELVQNIARTKYGVSEVTN